MYSSEWPDIYRILILLIFLITQEDLR